MLANFFYYCQIMLTAPPQVRLHPLLLFSSLSFPIRAIVTLIVGICSLWITFAPILFATLFSSLSFPIHAIVKPIVGICSPWITFAPILFATLLCMYFELNQ